MAYLRSIFILILVIPALVFSEGDHSSTSNEKSHSHSPQREKRERAEAPIPIVKQGDCARALLKRTQDGVLKGVRIAQENLRLNASLPKEPKYALTEILSVCAGLGRALGASYVSGRVYDQLAGNIAENTKSLHELSSALYKSCFEAEMAAVNGPSRVDFDVKSKQKLIRSLVDNLGSLISADKAMLDKKATSEEPDQDRAGKNAAGDKEISCRKATLTVIEDEVSKSIDLAEQNFRQSSKESDSNYKTFTLCADLTRALGAASLAGNGSDNDPKLAERAHRIASLSGKDSEVQVLCFSNRVEAVHPSSQKETPEARLNKLLEITKTLRKVFPRQLFDV